MDKKFLTKLFAAVLVAFGYFFLASASWQIAVGLGIGAFIVDYVVEFLTGGKGWMLFLFGLFGFFAHFWSGMGWDWIFAFGGYMYFAMDQFLVESKLADWLFHLLGF